MSGAESGVSQAPGRGARRIGDRTPSSRVLGTGSYAPERIVTNEELAAKVDTSDEWIRSRTGIAQRHYAAEGEVSSDMAAAAARRALKAAGLSPADLDMIIVGTVTPDQPIPGCAVQLQRKLGADDIPAFDIAAACAGFLYGITIADQWITSGAMRCILVVGVELLSRKMNWDDRTTCVLFGDGAGAVVMGPARPPVGDELPAGILATTLATDGSLAPALNIPAGGSLQPATPEAIANAGDKVHMIGKDVFRTAVKNLTACSAQTLKKSGLQSNQLDWVVAHQANIRILNQVSNRLGFAQEKFVINIDRFGNTSSASVPIALDEAVRDGRIKPGHTVLMSALGAGISWGAAVMRM